MKLIKIYTAAMMMFALAACGGDDSAPPASTPPSGAIGSGGTISKVTLSGQITYDHVPHKTSGFGLDYDAVSQDPARGILVVLLDASNEALSQTVTDGNGRYSFEVDPSVDVKIQARAQLERAGRWDVKITDNTLDNSLYAMEGDLSSSGTNARQTRDLHAPSGWNGTDYNSARVAAPFAILSPVYDAILAVDAVDGNANFPAFEYRWSPDNRPVAGNLGLGQIGTSGFHEDENAVYLLGDANRDTDEYDPHVIIHEWGHYFEHNLGRLDSMGGLHSLHEKLDPRLAFSEGFGNGLAAIITGDPVYKDSSGAGQGSGFEIDFEDVTTTRAGWFNEGSVAAILYDVYDSNADGNDRINAGFAPIYRAMTSTKDSEIFGTIFTFSDALLSQPGINPSDYASLLDSQNISSSDGQGAGERNNGTIASSLPVYKTAEIDGAPVSLCSVDDAGRFNKLGNREFVYFEIPETGNYEVNLAMISGDGARDPDFNIWQSGQIVTESASSQVNRENFAGELLGGVYVAEVYDFHNINGNSSRAGDACFEFDIKPI